jgi:hypothetical protein
MKNCKVLVGPIAGDEGVLHDEGDSIALDDRTADMFARFGYVEIEAEPAPTVPVAPSPLPGGDLPVAPAAVEVVAAKVAVEKPVAEDIAKTDVDKAAKSKKTT